MSTLPHLRLELLKTSAGTPLPPLSPKRRSFVVHVPYSTAEMTVECASHEPSAVITVNGRPLAADQPSEPLPLEPGRNVFDIAVKAADGSDCLAYTLKAIRPQATPNWTRVLEHAPFPERDSAGELVFNGRMWVLGGFLPELVDDVWSSEDGINWRFEGNIGAPSGLNIPVTFVHHDKMWVSSVAGELFASTDGKTWDLVNAAPPWGKRYAPGFAVFRGKMWVFGGREEGELFHDAWSSTDGLTWTREAAAAPWSPRQLFSNVVVKDEKLWLIGGGVTKYEPFRAYRDVWSSADGVLWELVTEQAPWPERTWSNCIVYRDRLFLFGGFQSHPKWCNFGDVWYSADGKDWEQLQTETCWTDRHELSAYVHLDKLWVIAGNPWPLFNDVWSLEISGLTFLTQPILEEHAGAGYEYRAHADFNGGNSPVRYRLLKAPDWLRVDAETGVVRGLAPREGGEFEVVLEAYDETGASAQQMYTLSVAKALGL